MGKDDPAPRPQRPAPQLMLALALRGITSVLVLSAVGFWISGFMATFHELHLQIIGSGWWQDGAIGISGLLLALVGSSAKVSALVIRRESGIQGLRKIRLRDVIIEVLGLAIFVGYGVLPLSIHSFHSSWTLLVLLGAFGAWQISKANTSRRRVEAISGVDRNDAELPIADSSQFSRRAVLSGGLVLGIGAPGFAVLWRALPTLIPDHTFFGHDSPIRSLSWFPDGRRIASADDNGRSFIWNADDGTVLQGTVLSTTTPTNVSVSPDGKLIAASDFSAMYMIDVATATLLWKKDIGYSDHPFSWAPDSAQVVVLSHSDVRIVDAATGSEATTRFVPPENFTPNVVAWSPNGTLIVAADGVHVVMWDATSGVERKTFTGPDTTISELAWSPNGDSLAFAKGDAVYIWLLRDTEIEEGMGFSRLNGYVPAISWSPDGRYIAFCVSLDKTVCVIEIATSATVFVYNGHFSPVWAVAWSPDGRRIASGGFDNLVHVWRPVLPA